MPTAVILDDEQTIKHIHSDKLHVRDGLAELGRGQQHQHHNIVAFFLVAPSRRKVALTAQQRGGILEPGSSRPEIRPSRGTSSAIRSHIRGINDTARSRTRDATIDAPRYAIHPLHLRCPSLYSLPLVWASRSRPIRPVGHTDWIAFSKIWDEQDLVANLADERGTFAPDTQFC